MSLMKQLYYTNLKIAARITAFFAIILIGLTTFLGNQSFFLLLNYDGGRYIDKFFAIITTGGEVIPWVAGLIFILIWRKYLLWLLVACFVISTIFVQGIKNVLPEQPRPTKAITNIKLVHTVEGVELYKVHSFPSGHTSAAFTVFFILCLAIEKRWIIPIGIIYASLVGYSRIYLAEHFPIDVGGGMLIAIASIFLSLKLWEAIGAKKATKIN